MPLATSRNASENLEKLLLTNNLFKRTLTALPLGAFVIYILLKSPIISQIFLCVVCMGCLIEWLLITLRGQQNFSHRLLWMGGGILYILFGSYFLIKIGVENPPLLLPLLAVIWMADIGAFFTGKAFGGPKLAPSISPGKTWIGAIGGFVIAFTGGLLFGQYMPSINGLIKPFSDPLINSFYLAVLIIVSQMGDLLESYAKRCFNIKDSSQILPGHGGFLDRLDSILGAGFLLSILSLIIQYLNF